MSNFHWLRALVVIALIAVAGCAVAPLREYEPTADLVVLQKQPVIVNETEMETVTFAQTLVNIPVGTTVGRLVIDGKVVREVRTEQADFGAGAPGWNRMALDELRAAGYPVLGNPALLFDQDDSVKSRFVVGGTIQEIMFVGHNASFHWNDNQTPMECGSAVTWQIYDTNLRRVVYTNKTRGYAQMPGVAPVLTGSIRSSFRAALADPAFASVIQKKGFSTPASISTAAPSKQTPIVPAMAPSRSQLRPLLTFN